MTCANSTKTSVKPTLFQWNTISGPSLQRTPPISGQNKISRMNLGFLLIRSTLPRADTSGERTADKIFVQKYKKINKFTSISGQNEKINILIKQKIQKQFRKRGYFVVIRRIRIFLRIFNDRDYFSCYTRGVETGVQQCLTRLSVQGAFSQIQLTFLRTVQRILLYSLSDL